MVREHGRAFATTPRDLDKEDLAVLVLVLHYTNREGRAPSTFDLIQTREVGPPYGSTAASLEMLQAHGCLELPPGVWNLPDWLNMFGPNDLAVITCLGRMRAHAYEQQLTTTNDEGGETNEKVDLYSR